MWCCPQQIVLYWSRLWAKSEEASELNLPPLPTSISIRKHLQNGDEVGGVTSYQSRIACKASIGRVWKNFVNIRKKIAFHKMPFQMGLALRNSVDGLSSQQSLMLRKKNCFIFELSLSPKNSLCRRGWLQAL